MDGIRMLPDACRLVRRNRCCINVCSFAGAQVLRKSCYFDSLEDIGDVRGRAEKVCID